jgi:UDP-2-acetamido-3-amino-2,3-dideoxy-glucuronate N-acetyltransferase
MNNVKIHPSADVQTKNIGSGTTIWQNCVILEGAKLGRNCNINALTFIENEVVIGDNVTVKCGVELWDGMHLEDGVFVGPNVTFVNDFLPRSKQHSAERLKTKLCKGSSLGANSTIMGGISVGKYAMVGAGSVVTRDVPDHGLVYGNPARLRGNVCECGLKLEDLFCKTCSKSYYKNGNGLRLKTK